MLSRTRHATLSHLHWQDDLLAFELEDAGRRIPCSISREALEDAGPGRRASRTALQDAFEWLRPRIERIVQAHLTQARLAQARLTQARLARAGFVHPLSGIVTWGRAAAIHVSTGDLNVPPDDPTAAMALLPARAPLSLAA